MTRKRGMAAGSPPGPVLPGPASGSRRSSRARRRGCPMSLRTPHRLLLIAAAAPALALVPAAASAAAASAAAASAAAASAAAAPGRYTTIDVPGAADTAAVGANDSGVISGFYTDSSGNLHGFVDRDGAFTTINVPGAADTVATVINDLGTVV